MALSVTGVVAYFYVNTVVVIAQQTDDTIQAEITGLADQYRQFGLVGLVRTIHCSVPPRKMQMCHRDVLFVAK